MDHKQKDLLKKAVVPMCCLAVIACILWLQYALVSQNIFLAYGVEPFHSASTIEGLSLD